jgi:uroporphyrinogen-III decarboxylase
MDTLQQQINIMSTKVDALHQLIEQLSSKLSDVATECKFGADQLQRTDSGSTNSYRSYQEYAGFDSSMEHKDVLADHTGVDSTTHNGDRQLAPEVQVQRLTAQLTAAYNRIAALEEQLLSRRIHS